jgi:hypothetical protein
MSKFKILIFVALVAVFTSVIVVPFIFNSIKSANPTLVNSAKKVILHRGEYSVGKKVKPGFYDIEALSDNVTFNSIKLTKKDKLVAFEMFDKSQIKVKGAGNVKLSPAKFKSLKQNERSEYVIEHSGYYIVGKQIPKGMYELKYHTKNGEKVTKAPFIQVLPKFRESPLSSFQLKENKIYNLNLGKNGNILQVNKTMFEENNEIIISLKQK